MIDRVPFPGAGDKTYWGNCQVGDIVEGFFVGERPGAFSGSYEYEIKQNDGSVRLVTSCGSTERAMPHLRVGAYVIFQYNGKQRSKRPGGAEFHAVDVAAGDGNDWLKTPRRPSGKAS